MGDYRWPEHELQPLTATAQCKICPEWAPLLELTRGICDECVKNVLQDLHDAGRVKGVNWTRTKFLLYLGKPLQQ